MGVQLLLKATEKRGLSFLYRLRDDIRPGRYSISLHPGDMNLSNTD